MFDTHPPKVEKQSSNSLEGIPKKEHPLTDPLSSYLTWKQSELNDLPAVTEGASIPTTQPVNKKISHKNSTNHVINEFKPLKEKTTIKKLAENAFNKATDYTEYAYKKAKLGVVAGSIVMAFGACAVSGPEKTLATIESGFNFLKSLDAPRTSLRPTSRPQNPGVTRPKIRP